MFTLSQNGYGEQDVLLNSHSTTLLPLSNINFRPVIFILWQNAKQIPHYIAIQHGNPHHCICSSCLLNICEWLMMLFLPHASVVGSFPAGQGLVGDALARIPIRGLQCRRRLPDCGANHLASEPSPVDGNHPMSLVWAYSEV